MAKHGLTRVQFRGDKAVVIAGPTPDTIAVRGLTEELVTDEPVETPMTPVRHITKKPNKPPRFVAEKPQAEQKEQVDNG